MPKHSSKRKRLSKALPALGFAGVSLSIAGGACCLNQRCVGEYATALAEPRNLSW